MRLYGTKKGALQRSTKNHEHRPVAGRRCDPELSRRCMCSSNALGGCCCVSQLAIFLPQANLEHVEGLYGGYMGAYRNRGSIRV